MRHLRGKSVCTREPHKNDTHPFLQTTFFSVSKARLIASSAHHLLVTVGTLLAFQKASPQKTPKMSENGFPGPRGPGVKKARKRVENESKTRKKLEK